MPLKFQDLKKEIRDLTIIVSDLSFSKIKLKRMPMIAVLPIHFQYSIQRLYV